MEAFKIGTTYKTRSIFDHNCVYDYTVTARSKKFITLSSSDWNIEKRVGITEHDGVETAMPEGRYSMAPMIRANKVEV